MKSKITSTKKKEPEYNNVRFNSDAFNLVKTFCEKRGYKIGVFCQIAAAEKIQKEVASKL